MGSWIIFLVGCVTAIFAWMSADKRPKVIFCFLTALFFAVCVSTYVYSCSLYSQCRNIEYEQKIDNSEVYNIDYDDLKFSNGEVTADIVMVKDDKISKEQIDVVSKDENNIVIDNEIKNDEVVVHKDETEEYIKKGITEKQCKFMDKFMCQNINEDSVIIGHKNGSKTVISVHMSEATARKVMQRV